MAGVIKQYLKETAVQIALIAIVIKLLLTMFFDPALSIDLEQVTTFALFGIVLIFIAHFIASKKVTLLNLFLIGFVGILVYNQGIVMLQLIGAVPILQDMIVGIEMGLIIMAVGYFRGVRK